MLRCANVIGPRVVSPVTSYFRLPVIPTVLGFDPRLQFLHEQDLNRVLRHAVNADVHGTFNVGGDGVLMLSQALRRLQRPASRCRASRSAVSVRRCARRGLADLSPELVAFLTYGRGVDTTRMRTELGFEPEYTTAEAFGEFASTLPPTGGRTERVLAAVAERLPEVSDDRPPALTLAGGSDG